MLPRTRQPDSLVSRVALVALLLALASPCQAADPAHYFNVPTFDIPITWGTGGQFKQATLYVSTNGQRFLPVSTVAAGKDSFGYTAPADGWYFFVLQLEGQDGRKWPDQITGDDVSLKVLVDREKPKITLRATVPQDGTVAVVWKVEERAIDSVQLEYSPKGRQEWANVPIKPLPHAQRSWTPTGAGPFDVRLTVRDRAGNVASSTTQVTPTTSRVGFPGTPGLTPRGEYHVASRKFQLKYKVDKVGPSDIKQVEIWWTEDTKTWQLLKDNAKREGPMPIEVRAEGLYGFTIRPVNGVGRGPEAPRPFQEPQIWVRVDETKPKVTLRSVVVVEAGPEPMLNINWTASDDHLADRPITIYTSPNGREWSVLGKAGMENTGTYSCPTKPLPYEFHVRVEAADKAGNKGSAETKDLVKVDTCIPEVKDIGVGVEVKDIGVSVEVKREGGTPPGGGGPVTPPPAGPIGGAPPPPPPGL